MRQVFLEEVAFVYTSHIEIELPLIREFITVYVLCRLPIEAYTFWYIALVLNLLIIIRRLFVIFVGFVEFTIFSFKASQDYNFLLDFPILYLFIFIYWFYGFLNMRMIFYVFNLYYFSGPSIFGFAMKNEC